MKSEYIFFTACAVIVIIMAVYYLRRKNRLTSLLTGVLTGVLSLGAVNMLGEYAGIYLPLNTFNTIASTVLGAPYVLVAVILYNF